MIIIVQFVRGEDIEEPLEDLFLHSSFASQYCWSSLNLGSDLNILSWPMANFGNLESKSTSTILHMEMIILMCWSIWVSRNPLIFCSRAPSIESSVEFFKHNFSMNSDETH